MSNPSSREINPHLSQIDDQGVPHNDQGNSLRYASDPSPEQAAELPTLELSSMDPSQDFHGRCQQVLLLAEEAFAKTGSWVIFYREILGNDGVVHQLFATDEELRRFQSGPEFETLHEMLAAIRSQDQSKSDAAEPERMITIRIPRSLHESLQEESKSCGLSINKLSISKLLFPANPKFVPEQRGRRRGRRPGPQERRKAKGGQASEIVDGATTADRLNVDVRGGSQQPPAHSWAD